MKRTYFLFPVFLVITIAAIYFFSRDNTRSPYDNYINKCTNNLLSIEIDSFLLSKIFSNQEIKNYLIYCYDINMCKPCIINDLDRIRKGLPGIPQEYIIVLVLTNESRLDHVAAINELHGLNYIEINRESYRLPVFDNIPSRFYGVLNNNGEWVIGFIPNNNPEDLLDFFQGISKNKWIL